MDKHEYMIWRAVIKYDLLHDESSGATEDNVEKLIDDRENEIKLLSPDYFVGKDMEQLVYHKTKFRFDRIIFAVYSDDYIKWSDGEFLYCGLVTDYLPDDPEHYRGNPNDPYRFFYGWRSRPLRSYYEIISQLRQSKWYKDFDYSNSRKVAMLFRDLDIISYRDVWSIHMNCIGNIGEFGEDTYLVNIVTNSQFWNNDQWIDTICIYTEGHKI